MADQPLLRNWPRSYRIRRNNANIRPLRRSRSFKVSNLGTNRKPVRDFLLVVNTNYLLCCTLSKLWLFICQIFANDRESLHFYQWRQEGGVRGGAAAPGGHLQGRHFNPLTT